MNLEILVKFKPTKFSTSFVLFICLRCNILLELIWLSKAQMLAQTCPCFPWDPNKQRRGMKLQSSDNRSFFLALGFLTVMICKKNSKASRSSTEQCALLWWTQELLCKSGRKGKRNFWEVMGSECLPQFSAGAFFLTLFSAVGWRQFSFNGGLLVYVCLVYRSWTVIVPG